MLAETIKIGSGEFTIKYNERLFDYGNILSISISLYDDENKRVWCKVNPDLPPDLPKEWRDKTKLILKERLFQFIEGVKGYIKEYPNEAKARPEFKKIITALEASPLAS